jgi:glycosyltransferase involved in cell wall biosynthesis
MLEAWKSVGERVPLRIVGDGPLANEVRCGAATIPGVKWLGPLAHEEVLREMKSAGMLIFPSIWYEGLPLTILEAFATGLPAVASNLGSIPELVEDGKTGLLFAPGSAGQLAEKVLWADSHPMERREMCYEARQEFEQKYTREKNYELLLACYHVALRQREIRCGESDWMIPAGQEKNI